MRGAGDGVGRAAIVLGVAELHDIEGRARDLVHVEIIAPSVGVDGHIGVDAARDGFNRKGPPAGHTVDLEAFRVAGDD